MKTFRKACDPWGVIDISIILILLIIMIIILIITIKGDGREGGGEKPCSSKRDGQEHGSRGSGIKAWH